jgi:hypothetical protein
MIQTNNSTMKKITFLLVLSLSLFVYSCSDSAADGTEAAQADSTATGEKCCDKDKCDKTKCDKDKCDKKKCDKKKCDKPADSTDSGAMACEPGACEPGACGAGE